MNTHTWRRFLVYCLLTLTLLALVPLIQIAAAVPSLDFGAMAQRASASSGVPWTSNLIDVVSLALVEPGLWLLLLGSAVPTLAALTLLLGSRNWQGLRDWCDRFNPVRVWRSLKLGSALAVAVVLTGLFASLVLTFEIRVMVGLDYERPAALLSAGLVPALLAAMCLDQGAVLEEGGWRGYATPLLQTGGVQPLHAALAIGLAWGLWHVPRDIVSGVPERLGGVSYALQYLPSFLAGTLSVSVLAAYCMNRLGGSVYPAIAIHGLGNDALGLSGTATIEMALTPLHQATKAAPLVALALGVILAAGSALGAAQTSGALHHRR